MISISALPHDRIQFAADEIAAPPDLLKLPWAQAGVARAVETRLGVEVRLGPYVGRLVVPGQFIIDIREPYPGTVAACLAITTPRGRAGDQISPSANLMLSPWSVIAIAFQRVLSDYVLYGIERRYISEVITTSRPRGRIDLGATITRVRSRGREDRVVCVPRILTEDTPLNRIVLAAAIRAEHLLLRDGFNEPLRKVRLALKALSGVRREVAPDIAAARVSLLTTNERPRKLLSLAELLINGVPALPPDGSQDPEYPMSAWVNVESLFEEAVRSSVRTAIGGRGSVRPGYGDGVTLFEHLAKDPITRKKAANPDVVIRHEGQVILLDAKYRRHEEDFTEGELYQLIAHAGAYRATAAALVTPSRNSDGSPERWIGRGKDGIEYWVISVDPSSRTGLCDPIQQWVRSQLISPHE